LVDDISPAFSAGFSFVRAASGAARWRDAPCLRAPRLFSAVTHNSPLAALPLLRLGGIRSIP